MEKVPAPVRSKVVRYVKAGKSPREIAWLLDISTQRVYQHIARARELGELPLEDDAA